MATPDSWSYWTFTAKNPTLDDLTGHLNALGVEGWELVTSFSTIKTWVNLTGNDLVLIFKKPGSGHAPSDRLRTTLSGNNPDQAW